MTETTIFPTDQDGNNEGKTPSITQVPTTPVIPVELQALVGEGKKYATLEDVHKAFPNAQNHITTLEADIATAKANNELLQAELAKRKTAEELLADIKQSATATSMTSTTVDATPDVLSEVVRNELARQAATSKATADADLAKVNQTKVVDSFKEKYGEKAEEFYSKLAADSSMTIADLNNLAVSSPEAVIRLAGLVIKPRDNSSSFSTTINTQALNNGQPNSNSGIRLGKNMTSKDLARAWVATREAVSKDLGLT
jgi:hypothetical protein